MAVLLRKPDTTPMRDDKSDSQIIEEFRERARNAPPRMASQDFGPGDEPPALYIVEARVIDTEGHTAEAGEEMEAGWVTISRTDSHARTRGEEFFSSVGFEIQSEIQTNRHDIDGDSPQAFLQQLQKVAGEAEGHHWV